MFSHTLLFDFDGTIAIGDGPVLAYAKQVGAHLAPRDAERLLNALHRGELGDAADGYEYVHAHADAHGIRSADLGACYLASRELLGSDAAPVSAPPGITTFLDALPPSVRVVLATNAPDIRIAETLDALGLGSAFATTHTAVGKPDGLSPILADLLRDGPVLSIGDVWANDLVPAQRAGAATALISARELPTETPTFRAPKLELLYDSIMAWLDRSAPRTPTRKELHVEH